MTTARIIRIKGMLEGCIHATATDKVYDVTPETVKAAIVVLEERPIDSKPVELTELTKAGQYPFNKPVQNISGRHLPSHTRVGDVLEITDRKTKETYQGKLTENFYNLCRNYRPGYAFEDQRNAETLKKALADAVESKSEASLSRKM